MSVCTECGNHRLRVEVVPEYDTEIGGLKVQLRDAVARRICEDCGEVEDAIPDMEQLTAAVAMARALLPYRLQGPDVKLMRLALDMNGRKFAKAMKLKPETLSRWENDGQCLGGYADQLLRHNVCALLHQKVPVLDYDPAAITTMDILDMPDDAVLPTMVFRRVVVRDRHQQEDAWDSLPMAA